MPEEINASKGSLSNSDTAPSAASNSTISDLEDFIDSSFFNVNGAVAPNFAQVSGTSTPLQQQDDDTSDSFELQFFSFKTKTEFQLLDLLSKMSEQNQVIDACKQDLCKLRSQNLNLISRISFLEKKLSIVNHSEYDFNEQQSNNVRHQTIKPTSPPNSIVRHTSRQSDKPNRSPNRDVNAIPKKDISQPEVLFVYSTSKPVNSQITHQFIEAVSPALSLNSAKQKSSQSDDSIKLSNVRSVRDPQFKSASKLLSEKSAKDTVQVNSGTNNLTNLLNSKP
jgi:hypothetical protein